MMKVDDDDDEDSKKAIVWEDLHLFYSIYMKHYSNVTYSYAFPLFSCSSNFIG